MGRPRSCHCGECAKCKRADYMREWYRRQSPEKKAAIVAARDAEKMQAQRSKYLATRSEEARERDRQAKAKWRAENPEKRRAQNKVNNALRLGHISKEPCEVCGDSDVHGHHDDYSKPLDIRWLCPAHHSRLHAELRMAA